RRRHTRFSRDWSSDVCSSDLSYEILSSQKVGPTIANDIKSRAIYAGIFSVIVIALYILIRFHKWQYSLAAAIPTIHDTLIILIRSEERRVGKECKSRWRT